MNFAKQQKSKYALAIKICLGFTYGLTWLIVAEPTWENLYHKRPYHEGILFQSLLVFIILPCLIGGFSSFMDYKKGHSGPIAAFLSGWTSCFIGALTSVFCTDTFYGLAMTYIFPILGASSIGGVAVNIWLRRNGPVIENLN